MHKLLIISTRTVLTDPGGGQNLGFKIQVTLIQINLNLLTYNFIIVKTCSPVLVTQMYEFTLFFSSHMSQYHSVHHMWHHQRQTISVTVRFGWFYAMSLVLVGFTPRRQLWPSPWREQVNLCLGHLLRASRNFSFDPWGYLRSILRLPQYPEH